ncbi:MAG: hypothetical protein ACXU8A_03345 [Burkholderiaceae bacterium]
MNPTNTAVIEKIPISFGDNKRDKINDIKKYVIVALLDAKNCTPNFFRIELKRWLSLWRRLGEAQFARTFFQLQIIGQILRLIAEFIIGMDGLKLRQPVATRDAQI